MPEISSEQIVLYEGVSLWIACMTYVYPLKKKSNLPARMAVSALLGVGAAVLPAFFYLVRAKTGGAEWTAWYIPVFDYFCAVAVTAICADVRGAEAWYCGIWASMTNLCVLQGSVFLLKAWADFNTPWKWYAGQILLAAAVFTAITQTAARWMPKDGHYDIGPRQMLLAGMVYTMFGLLFLNAIHGNGQPGVTFLLQFYCITVLYLQNTLFRKSSIQKELDMIQLLLYQQKEQYQISKETIDLINRKCHDLKHQVRAMRTIEGEKERDAYLKEIEQSVQIYDAIVHTGNEILDVILTEKSLFCSKDGIHVSCVADGSLLSFMEPVDLYALLGNALDNAMEALRMVPKENERVIDIMLFEKRGFAVLQIINPVSHKVRFRDGIPVSTKVKNGYHGFGVKSMQHIAQKYGGFLTAEIKQGCFYLIVLMPLHGREDIRTDVPLIHKNEPFVQNELNL